MNYRGYEYPEWIKRLVERGPCCICGSDVDLTVFFVYPDNPGPLYSVLCRDCLSVAPPDDPSTPRDQMLTPTGRRDYVP